LDGLERALAYAEGRPWLIATILTSQAAARIWGPTPAAEIERWSVTVLETYAGEPMAEAAAMMARAYAEALKGDASSARQLANRARSIYADMGVQFLLARSTSVLSLIELLAGDLTATERGLRESYDTLRESRETGFLSTVVSILADALCDQDKIGEAEQMAERAIEM